MRLASYTLTQKSFNLVRVIDSTSGATAWNEDITVLLPVYNKQRYIAAAIDSILRQTWTKLRLLIINDGSSDKSLHICQQRATLDNRIDIISHHNQGLIKTLNRGLAQVATPYVARMDADDYCEPGRIEKQISLLRARPDVGVCGTFYRKLEGSNLSEFQRPHTSDGIETFLLFDNPIAHGSVVARTAILKNHGGYPDHADAVHVEDYALWTSLVGYTKFANLPEYLYTYRVSSDSVSGLNHARQLTNRDKIAEQYGKRYFRKSNVDRLLQPLRISRDAKTVSRLRDRRLAVSLLKRSAAKAAASNHRVDAFLRHFLAAQLVGKRNR